MKKLIVISFSYIILSACWKENLEINQSELQIQAIREAALKLAETTAREAANRTTEETAQQFNSSKTGYGSEIYQFRRRNGTAV